MRDIETPAHFESVLFRDGSEPPRRGVPECFRDLNLDLVVETVTSGKSEYDLAPFFYAPLAAAEDVRYRQEVMRDLQNGGIARCVRAFSERMQSVRRRLSRAEKLRDPRQRDRWQLHAVDEYCRAVKKLREELSQCQPRSAGLRSLLSYLDGYTGSQEFAELDAEARALASDLANVCYCVVLREGGFSVRSYADERDYSEEIAHVFEKFRQSDVKNYFVDLQNAAQMSQVEEKILEFVALLEPDVFLRLSSFAERHGGFLDRIIGRFDREVQFYVSYVDFTRTFEGTGLEFCFPVVSETSKETEALGVFDLALAIAARERHTIVISNDVTLRGPERVLVVSGPNQGGKTTYARAFGQLHYLASIGCPVPATRAGLFLPDAIYTHFEREESAEVQRGKLEDDLVRVREIFEHATQKSVIILNEIFSSTSLEDAVFLAQRVFERVLELDALCLCVTFLDELASLSEKTVSMVSMVDPADPAVRTYKVVRHPAEGKAYAISVAERHGLSFEKIKQRMLTRSA